MKTVQFNDVDIRWLEQIMQPDCEEADNIYPPPSADAAISSRYDLGYVRL